MKSKAFFLASAAALVLYIMSVSAALAAPLEQDQTAVPPDSRYLTITPRPGTPGNSAATPTVIPPPNGGGRVVVDVLYVRASSSFGSTLLGSLLYNQVVFPRGRSADGRWIAIDWNGHLGWVFFNQVDWDTNLDINALPIFDILASGTAEQISPVPLLATATIEPEAIAAVATSVPSSPQVVLPEEPASGVPVSIDAGQFSLDTVPTVFLWFMGGAMALVVGYFVRRWQGHLDFVRYEKGFPVKICPACGEGHLVLDETTRSTLGIMRTTRSVRCDNCRSVLREVRPGAWRYTVDPMANPSMAQRYSTSHLTIAEIQKIAVLRTTVKSVQNDFSEKSDESSLINDDSSL